jgi:hypothetical protein
MYSIFTGSSDRMPFQMMTKNETAFVASAHPFLGAHWDWSQEEVLMKMIMLCTVTLCGLVEGHHYVGSRCLCLVPWWWQNVSLEHWYLCQTTWHHTPEDLIVIKLSDLTRFRNFTSIVHVIYNGWTVQSRCVSCQELRCVLLGNWKSAYHQLRH